MSVLITGSMAIDDIATQSHKKKNLLGGSASYASVAASFFSKVFLVSVVGTDFPEKHRKLFKKHKIDLAGLEAAKGKTFRWSGVYEKNMNNRRTLSVHLNVFETFTPRLPEKYRRASHVLLANISPDLQLQVLDQLHRPKFVVADTMDLWINTTRRQLLKLLSRVNLLILNDSEARQLSGEDNLIRAAAWLRKQGPPFVAIKKGEHGCLLCGPKNAFFTAPAVPLDRVVDPTGAGDSFAGGLVGHLASSGKTDFESLKQGVIEGTILASFTVQDFSLNRLTKLTPAEMKKRKQLLRGLTHY